MAFKHWFVTAVLVAAAGFLGYSAGESAGLEIMNKVDRDHVKEVRATLERDLKPCYAQAEREIQAGSKSPSLRCHYDAYLRAVSSL